MSQDQLIQAFNIAGATFLVQFLLLTILIIGTYIANAALLAIDTSNTVNYKDSHIRPIRLTAVLIAVLVSFAALLISDSFFTMWGPVFQGIGLNTISTSSSIAVVFGIDLIVVTYLIWLTGGSTNSPFTAVLFTLPALAIFLRLPPSIFLTCAAYSALAYLMLLKIYQDERSKKSKSSIAFINISCLSLSILTGYITRPIPI